MIAQSLWLVGGVVIWRLSDLVFYLIVASITGNDGSIVIFGHKGGSQWTRRRYLCLRWPWCLGSVAFDPHDCAFGKCDFACAKPQSCFAHDVDLPELSSPVPHDVVSRPMTFSSQSCFDWEEQLSPQQSMLLRMRTSLLSHATMATVSKHRAPKGMSLRRPCWSPASPGRTVPS